MDRLKPYYPILLFGLLCCPPPLRAAELVKAPSLDADAPASPPTEGKAAGADLSDKVKKPALTKNEIAVWSLFSAAGAAVITGAIFGLTALDEQDRYDKNPASIYRHRRDDRMITSAVFFGTAGAAAIATLALWAIDKKHRRKEGASTGAPAASVSFDPDGALQVAF